MVQRVILWFLICLTLTLTFQGHLIFENSSFVPVRDWCTFGRDMFINSGDIAHWNMEKLPMLYDGNFRCHGNLCYVFLISPIFCTFHRIWPSIMCVNFEKNQLKIDDFRRFHKSTISHRKHTKYWKFLNDLDLWPLFDLDLEFDLWPWRFEEIHCFHFFSFSLKSRDTKTWRRT